MASERNSKVFFLLFCIAENVLTNAKNIYIFAMYIQFCWFFSVLFCFIPSECRWAFSLFCDWLWQFSLIARFCVFPSPFLYPLLFFKPLDRTIFRYIFFESHAFMSFSIAFTPLSTIVSNYTGFCLCVCPSIYIHIYIYEFALLSSNFNKLLLFFNTFRIVAFELMAINCICHFQFAINFHAVFFPCSAPYHQNHLIHFTRTAIHFKCPLLHHGFRRRYA